MSGGSRLPGWQSGSWIVALFFLSEDEGKVETAPGNCFQYQVLVGLLTQTVEGCIGHAPTPGLRLL